MNALSPDRQGNMAGAKSHDLKLRDLSKKYDQHGEEYAVHDMNLDVVKGEFVSFLGPSGSGKTTTLMMIAGFESLTSGDIEIDGRSIAGFPPEKRNIGMVFQNYALFPKMTVANNIGFPLKMRGISGNERTQAVERLLNLVDLPGYGHRYPRQLSGGQQQRVALARALVFGPNILLLDEPMGALDRKLREQLQMELKKLQRSLGITTIYVTHDQEEAMVLSDRIVIMDQGKVQQVGTPSEVYYQPANSFAAKFLGVANMIAGEVVRESRAGGIGKAAVAGAELHFYSANAVPKGAKVDLFLRPECIALDGHGDGADKLEGKIESAIFVGEATRVTVRLSDGTLMNVTNSNSSGFVEFAVGNDVTLSWDRGRALALTG